jgi:3-carboxy-cis,cis-muconate cycloisomerase
VTSARGLFGGVFARGPVADAVDDQAWLRAMLDAEAALAAAQASVGLIPGGDAEAIRAVCRGAVLDIDAIGRAAADGGNPVIPTVEALRAAVGGSAAAHVHRGATSQDILDTAAMLVVQRASESLIADLRGAADAAASLAQRNRATPMAGRTLMQQALPTSFGWEAVAWMTGLDAAVAGITQLGDGVLAVQLGGPVGTLGELGDVAPQVVRAFATELGLAEPAATWHTERSRIGRIAGALAVAAGACGKVAQDIVLLAQTEVGEVREGMAGRGGSSSMGHKHNPIAAISALACARQAPGLASTLFASAVQEHQRAAGAWHAEWLPLGALLRTTGSAAAWLRDSLEHLEVDAQRMATNLRLGEAPQNTVAAGVAAAAISVDRALAARSARS